MRKELAIRDRISTKILVVLLILFSISAVVVSIINQNNIRRLYEENFTERVLLTNALLAATIDSDDVDALVRLIKSQDDQFKQRQIQFYHDRLEYWDLLEAGATEEELAELISSLTAFQHEMSTLKTEKYWQTVEVLRHLKEVSNSSYLYVMADTGMMNDDGEELYTFILDADDTPLLYTEEPDIDGLGTSDTSQDTIKNVYETKQQMDYVVYYNDVYGELYYAYAPIINRDGEVIAVFGTDLDLKKMNSSIASSTLLFNAVLFAAFIFIIFILFIYLHRSIVMPLGSLTNTAHELAEGNIYAPTSKSALKQRSEMGLLAHAVSDMSGVYQDMMSNAGRLFAAANIGKLDVRSDESKFKGDIANFISQINATLDAITLYLNSIPESIFIMNKDFDIYFRNNSFDEVFGDMPAMEILSVLFPLADNGDAQRIRKSLKTQVAAVLKQENNNTSVWINDSCFSIILKEIDLDDTADNSILVIAIDITDLMREKENAQAAAEAKSSFLSRMSHEMRTPMNAIIGMAKIAENTEDVAKLRYCLETIDTSSRHLLGIINDVLDMAKIEAGKFDINNSPMNIEKILMKVRNIVIENIEKKQQEFNVIIAKDLDLNYIGDELRLSQVITNLLFNAVKFTPEAGKITLAVEKTGQQENISTLRFSIADTGIGMTSEQISRLWGAFEQADGSVTRKYGGTGLGLPISKNIIEKMGGHIWAESQPGAGSTFCFEISLEHISHTKLKALDIAASKEDEAPDLSGMHIILAEDVEINREIALALLESTNIDIDCAANGAEAVEMFIANPAKYDMIFMDIQMPEMDGFTATKNIRASGVDRAAEIPIVAMTANVFREDIENCLAAGMDDHIGKPIDQGDMFAKLEKYCRKS